MPTTMAAATRTCRILYYGPAGSGKRENLARIQSSLPREHRLAMATEDPARHMAFMLHNGNQGDWQIFIQALDSGREPAVGSGTKASFDGIVFVCDSRPGKLDESLSAMEGLKTYLDCWRLDIMSVPMVLQYNHRDSDGVLAVDRLESLLNPWGLLSFPAVASSGEGVREPLKAILSLTISSVLQRQVSEPPAVEEQQLEIDPNPPLPGTLHQSPVPQPFKTTRPVDRMPPSAPYETGASATLVIPVRVPRSALESGAGRFMLDVHIIDD